MTFERVVEAPLIKTWTVMTDIERYVFNFRKVDNVQLLTPGEFGAGTRWRETRTVYGGRPATVECVVTACETFRRYTTEAEVDARAITEFGFEPECDDNRTLVRITFRTVEGSRAYRLREFLHRRQIRRCVSENNTQDLLDLAQACED